MATTHPNGGSKDLALTLQIHDSVFRVDGGYDGASAVYAMIATFVTTTT